MNIRNDIRTIQAHIMHKVNGDKAMALKCITKMQEMIVNTGKDRQMAILAVAKNRIIEAV